MKQRMRIWVVAADRRLRAEKLLIAFGPARSRIRTVELLDPRGDAICAPTAPLREASNIVELDLDRPALVEHVAATLHVEFADDAPHVRAIAWVGATEDAFKSFLLPIDPFLRVGAFADERRELVPLAAPRSRDDEAQRNYLVEFWIREYGQSIEFRNPSGRAAFVSEYSAPHFDEVTGSRDVFAIRRAAAELDQRARAFFLALDVGAMNEKLPEGWRQTVDHVNTRLGARVDQRVACGQDMRVPTWLPSPRFLRKLQQVSLYVRTLVSIHFPDGELSPDRPLALFEWALTRFAVEGLAVSHPDPQVHKDLLSHGAPDGELFFRLTELAFACIDHEIDVEFWEARLSILVLAAHVYAEHGAELVGARPDPGDPTRALGRYVYAYRENRRFPRGRLNELQHVYPPQRPLLGPGRRYDAGQVTWLEDHFTSVLAQALEPSVAGGTQTRSLDHPVAFRRQDTADSSIPSIASAFATQFL